MPNTPAADGRDPGPGPAPRAGVVERVIRRVARAVFGLSVVLVAIVALGFAWFLGSVPTAEPAVPERADGIVALTGGASRVSDAVELMASGHGRRLLITGVHPSARPRDIARHVPEHERIFTCCVDLDRSAVNTLGNATEARRWAQAHAFRSLIVVTSAYHMPRAMAELAHQLPGVRLIPFPVVTEKMRDGQWWSRSATARLLITEYAKFVLALVRIHIGREERALAASRVSAGP
jgi:uncharacterized SAM-binding protein YcdF (DUF218 family)